MYETADPSLHRTIGDTVMATYRVIPGKEDTMVALLERLERALGARGFLRNEPHLLFRGEDESGKVYFVHHLKLKDEMTFLDEAAALPVIGEIWEEIAALVEDRLGSPGMEFPVVRALRPPPRAD